MQLSKSPCLTIGDIKVITIVVIVVIVIIIMLTIIRNNT